MSEPFFWEKILKIFQNVIRWNFYPACSALTLVLLNKLRCHVHFKFSANQITWSRLLIKIHILNGKKCRSRSVGFFRSQLIWIYTVCKGRTYLGSAGLGLILTSSPLTFHHISSTGAYRVWAVCKPFNEQTVKWAVHHMQAMKAQISLHICGQGLHCHYQN